VSAGGGEKVINLIAAGDSFGETVLQGESAVRSASVSTLDPTELVLVPKAKFLAMLERFPELDDELQSAAEKRRTAPRVPTDLLGEYVSQGLYQGQKLLALDLTKCTRCDECTKACADSHPDHHARLLRDGLRFGQFLVATSCRSCHTPYCMDGCPVDAIHRRGTHLEVVIEDHCIGCGLCERNCPYGSIHMVQRATPNKSAAAFADGNPHLTAARKAVNCDLCNGTEPYCVDACPHDAALRIDGQGLLKLVQGRRG
jgi:Fe-S-cluster-containing hydrogenase component 2